MLLRPRPICAAQASRIRHIAVRCKSALAVDASSPTQPPRLRFAPSPTGSLHLGGLRTALFNYLLARKWGGKFILRIEDTDRKRFVEGSVEGLQRALEWAELEWDEGPGVGGPHGPYFQSERTDLYRSYADKLLASGHAYRDFASPNLNESKASSLPPPPPRPYSQSEDDLASLRAGLPYVVRLNMPKQDTVHQDLVYGRLTIPASASAGQADPVLLKSDGFPTYHLANVVDDYEMGITHILRGEEWIASLPKHLALYSALGLPVPQFAHLPLLINPDGSKLSKRSGDVSVEDYIQKGWEPEALVNFVALMGWSANRAQVKASADVDPEVLSKEALISAFSLENIPHRRAAMFAGKLSFLNKHHIALKASNPPKLGEMARRVRAMVLERWPETGTEWAGEEYVGRVVQVIKDRIHNLSEIPDAGDYFFVEPDLSNPSATALRESSPPEEYATVLSATLTAFESIPPAEFSAYAVSHAIGNVRKDNGWKNKAVMNPLRCALTGKKMGPGVVDTVELLGRDRALRRLRKALEQAGAGKEV